MLHHKAGANQIVTSRLGPLLSRLRCSRRIKACLFFASIVSTPSHHLGRTTQIWETSESTQILYKSVRCVWESKLSTDSLVLVKLNILLPYTLYKSANPKLVSAYILMRVSQIWGVQLSSLSPSQALVPFWPLYDQSTWRILLSLVILSSSSFYNLNFWSLYSSPPPDSDELNPEYLLLDTRIRGYWLDWSPIELSMWWVKHDIGFASWCSEVKPSQYLQIYWMWIFLWKEEEEGCRLSDRGGCWLRALLAGILCLLSPAGPIVSHCKRLTNSWDQGELRGGRNCFWRWKDKGFCMHGAHWYYKDMALALQCPNRPCIGVFSAIFC